MDSLGDYGSDGDEGGPRRGAPLGKASLNVAPDVALETKDLTIARNAVAPGTKELMHNVPYSDYSTALVGTNFKANKNVLTGHFERTFISPHTFNTFQRSFNNLGYTVNPDAQSSLSNTQDPSVLVGSRKRARETGFVDLDDRRLVTNTDTRKRLPKGNPEDIEGFKGPWAGYEGELRGDNAPAPTPEELAAAGLDAPAEAGEAAEDPDKPDEPPVRTEKSTFHGKSFRDYQGRTYMHPPTDVDANLKGEPGSQQCYIPKKLIHTWSGHTKGVSAIRFFPKTAHLLLSAGMDGKVKLWDVYHDRKCLRTFNGHTKAVRDICFNNDGSQFLSASFDKWIKLWDTETGHCLKRFTTSRIPFCVALNPDPDKQHEFLVGCGDKKIHQFDMNTGEIVQEYDQHMGAVNTITFIDENRRFVTTSDDKTLRVWEYGIPVVIKYVADPAMHSMPAVTVHPNQKWIACTSLDNQIVTFSVGDKIKQHRTKVFKGHIIAGYSCKPGFSPDGRFIMSGDSTGNLWFWDWKTSRIYSKLRAHDGVIIGCEWNPHQTSQVATCSWDGSIKLFA